jgi:YbbR domain-containing protein
MFFRVIFGNWRLKLTALVVACGMWVGVVYATNPPAITTVAVPVQVNGLGANLLLLHPIQAVPIRVAGVASNVRAATVSAHLAAAVNLKNIKGPGEYEVPLTVTKTDPNFALLSSPNKVLAVVDVWKTAALPVHVVISKAPPAGYNVNNSATTVAPATVQVRAPSSVLANLLVEAKVNLGSVLTSASIPATVSLVNTGNLTQQITYQPTVVTVHAVISSTTTSATLAVNATVTGQVAAGSALTGIQTTPPTVVATGASSSLAGLAALDTQPVDLSGLSKDTTIQVPLVTPAGVSTSVTVVTVVVTISALPSAVATPTPTPTPIPTASPSP